MKRLLFCILAIVVLNCNSFSQAVYLNRVFQDATGSPLFNPILNIFGVQWSSSIVRSSGDLMTVGYSSVSGQGQNIYLVNYDSGGNITFTVSYNSSGTFNDYGIGLYEASNGDILVCGSTDNGGSTNYDIVVLRYSSTGSLLYSNIQDGPAGKNDVAVSINEDGSGNVLVAANTEATNGFSDYWVLMFDPALNLSNTNTYDYTGLSDIVIGLEFSTMGNVCLVGASASGTVACDYAMATFDGTSLSYLSETRNNIPGTALDQALAFCKDASNNTYITGKAWNGTNFDIKTVKIASNFSIAWTATLDVNGFDDAGSTIDIDASGNVIVGGYGTNSGNIKSLICLKYNSGGSLQWQYSQPSNNATGDSYIKKLTVDQTTGHIYFVAGEKGSSSMLEALVGKIKSTGERNWLKSVSNSTLDILPSDIKFQSGDIYVISILNPTSPSYQTTEYSEMETDTTAIYENGKPSRLQNHLLVTFQHNCLIPSSINNKELMHGTIKDFIDSASVADLSDLSGLRDIGDYKCYKVLPWMVMDDSMSITRSGRLIKIYPHYSTFGILLPGSTHDSIPLKSISTVVNVIRHAQYNRFVFLDIGANDTEYTNGNSAGLKTNSITPNANINIEPAWDQTVGDPAIRVGIFDTGINFTHLDFGNGTWGGSNKIAGGYNYSGNIALSNNISNDIFGHGTAVADKIGALRNNNYAISGIAGGDGASNTGVKIYDMKIFGIGPNCFNQLTTLATEGNVLSAIVQGATNNTVTGSGLVQNIQNHSWGGIPLYGLIMQAFITAYQNEVILVCSSGNNAQSYTTTCGGYSYPSSYKDNIVMKVGANNNTGARAIFSECDHRLDFIAPGTSDLYSSLTRTGTTLTDIIYWPPNPACTLAIDGTSFGAPHAAGTAALLLSYANNTFMPNGLFPEDVEQLMQLSATDLTVSPNASGYDPETGWGRVNAGQALYNYYYAGYLVLHHTFTVSAATAYTLGGVFENACMAETRWGQQYGQYSKVKRYKITGTASHTPPTGYTFVAGWERGAGSNLMGILTNTAGVSGPAVLCYTNGVIFEETRYMPDATNIIPTAPVSSVSANFEGYIYEIYDPATNLPITFYPFGLSGTAVFAYSTYWRSLTVGLDEAIFTENSVYMFPNPTMDKIYFKSRIQGIDKIDVEILNALGQVVTRQNNLYLGEANYVDVSYLSNGIYFAKLTYGKKTIVNKIIIAK